MPDTPKMPTIEQRQEASALIERANLMGYETLAALPFDKFQAAVDAFLENVDEALVNAAPRGHKSGTMAENTTYALRDVVARQAQTIVEQRQLIDRQLEQLKGNSSLPPGALLPPHILPA
jgi:hypothetical protein